MRNTGIMYKITIVLLSVSVLSGIVYADKPSTNEQFVMKAISHRFAIFLDSLALTPSAISLKTSTDLGLLAADAVEIVLADKGWRVDNEKTGSPYEVEVTLSAFEFRYDKGSSRGFLNKPNIKRKVAGQLLVNYSGSSFNHISFLDFSETDEVAPEHENYVASIRYKQLAVKPKLGGMSRYLEPLAVTATVGGLIYLFFVNR